jgi:tetratricopeptide (TPR) repeat protein
VLAEEGATGDTDIKLTEWVDRFDIEHDNFRAALDWLTETGDAEWGLRLGAALFRFWETREYLAEGRDRLGKLLQLPGAARPTMPRLRALFAAGVLGAEQGDYDDAESLISQSLEIARQLGDKHSMAVSLNALGVNARDSDNLPAAANFLEQSLALWRETRRSSRRSPRHQQSRERRQLTGGLRARALYEECLSIFRELDDRAGIAWALNHQGDVARDQGDSAAAQSFYQSSLAIFRELDDRWGVAGSLADLGNLAREQRDYRAADSLCRKSLNMFHALEHKRGIARLLESFACSAAEQSDPERSLRLAGVASALRESIGAPLTPCEQAKLERALEPTRRGLTTAASRTAWLEGGSCPSKASFRTCCNPPLPQVPADYTICRFYSAVVGSISRRTAEMRFAGIPARLAWSRIVTSSGAR